MLNTTKTIGKHRRTRFLNYILIDSHALKTIYTRSLNTEKTTQNNGGRTNMVRVKQIITLQSKSGSPIDGGNLVRFAEERKLCCTEAHYCHGA